jgi:hypothetical protein
MLKQLLTPAIFWVGITFTLGQQQSAIYDATAIMNAKSGLNALLIPIESSAGGTPYEILDLQTGQIDLVRPVRDFKTAANDPVCRAVILEILRRNASLPATATDVVILRTYSTNPFLSSILTDAPPTVDPAIDIQSVDPYPASSVSGSLGTNLLGNVVNGTADFLIKRAHEEISIGVIEKLKKLLELHPEFQKLFPRTCALLEPIKPYEYSRALAAFKAAIKEDMENFVTNISSLYDIPRYQLLNERVPSLSLLFTASTLLSEAHQDNTFAASMTALPSKSFMSEANNYTAMVRLLTTISNSLLDQKLSDIGDKPLRFINKLFISRVTHNDPVMTAYLSRIYLGLLWQRTSSINFATSAGGVQNMATFLNRWSTGPNIEDAIQIVNNAVGFIGIAEKKLQELKESEEETRRITGENHILEKRFTYYSELISGVLDMVVLFQDPASPTYARLREITDFVPQFTSSISSMIKNISEEEYSLAISEFEESLSILAEYLKRTKEDEGEASSLKTTIETSINAEILAINTEITTVTGDIASIGSGGAPLVQAEQAARRQEYFKERNELQIKKARLERQKKNLKTVVFNLSEVIKYVNLLAALTKAENSEAVERLLETYALPVGSSRIKKVTKFNIAANSYIGGYFGRSGLPGSGFSNEYGFTAPIGLTFSTGFKKWGSVSLFLSAFDIGGTVRYKLNNQGKYEQDVTFAGIISPSAQIVLGFPFYFPVSFGFGVQWITPAVENTNNIPLMPTFNTFIGIDIPLFNLTRSK